MPTVTAAITTYDRAALVVEALESVLAQTYEDYELIVVDDGSSDDTRERLAPYSNRLRYVYQQNRGRAAARNTALGLAAGRYVAFLDSDDAWLPDKLERQVSAIETRPDVGLVHGFAELVDEAGRPLAAKTALHRREWEQANRAPVTYAGLALDCRCLTSAALLRTEALRELGGYDEALSALEDLDLYLRLALRREVLFLGGPPLARYRVHPGQTGSTETTRSRIAVCSKHLALGADGPQARRNLYLSLAGSYHVLGDARQTRSALLNAARIDPLVLLDPRALRPLTLSLLPRGPLRRAVRR